jgi:outer membrane protein assembly factor BamD (BamD/ComL family)
MRTFVDLEMWELALEKANAIVKDFPGSREAELVSRNLNEIRWKAEPKFVAQTAPLSADQERELREKGLTAMLQHVRTYMDLEMWELARQKALALIKAFPDSPEAAELMKVLETLERKARGSAEPAAKA